MGMATDIGVMVIGFTLGVLMAGLAWNGSVCTLYKFRAVLIKRQVLLRLIYAMRPSFI